MQQYPDLQAERDLTDERIHHGFRNATAFWNRFPAAQSDWQERKPFNQGEYNHYTQLTIPNPNFPNLVLWRNDVEKIFHNYDVSFHNELWSSAFSGKFAAGTTWHWERVFWWEDAMPEPPAEWSSSIFQQYHPSGYFSNQPGAPNYLDINGSAKEVKNQPLLHHFRPLADLLFRPSVLELGVFTGPFVPNKFFDDDPADPNPIESYYLQSTMDGAAVGWVHNRNASIAKSFYVTSDTLNQNFLGCTAPDSVSITLSGFMPLHAHYITWLPTRTGATDLPPDTSLMSTASGDITIDLSGHFNGIDNNYLDTLHSDYAFVITPQPFVKSLNQPATEEAPSADWDFKLYPNPTRDLLTLRFEDEGTKDVAVLDVAGRCAVWYAAVTSTFLLIPADRLAKGAYWVQVRDGPNMKTKKLIIH